MARTKRDFPSNRGTEIWFLSETNLRTLQMSIFGFLFRTATSKNNSPAERKAAKPAQTMGSELKREMNEREFSIRYKELVSKFSYENYDLNKEEIEKLHSLAKQSRWTGERSSYIAKFLMETGKLDKEDAELLARTEASRAGSILTQIRSERAGSTGYVWRSHKDARTRASHKAMNGKFIRWDSPPTIDGVIGHAGTHLGCRCFAMPKFP